MSTPQEICFPDPANSVIPQDHDTEGPRKKVEYLMKGQVVYILAKAYVFGPIAGLFQLFTLWMIYLSWSTMHFCQCLFIFFFFILETFTTLGLAMNSSKSGWVLYFMTAYNIVGCVWLY